MRKYKALVDLQKRDGTLASVVRIVEHVIGKPSSTRADWPYVATLKEALRKLKVKHDAKKGKRGTLVQQLYLHWRDLPLARRPPPAPTAAASPA